VGALALALRKQPEGNQVELVCYDDIVLWVYFDASALVKRYSSEDGTELVNELFHRLPVEQMTCAVKRIPNLRTDWSTPS
jgi:hypothetical protein